jgi:hypothetical protein
MEAKEKALELMQRFNEPTMQWNELDGFIANKYTAKTCALIAVDEILDVDCCDMSEECFDNHIEYWEEVKQEIEKL